MASDTKPRPEPGQPGSEPPTESTSPQAGADEDQGGESAKGLFGGFGGRGPRAPGVGPEPTGPSDARAGGRKRTRATDQPPPDRSPARCARWKRAVYGRPDTISETGTERATEGRQRDGSAPTATDNTGAADPLRFERAGADKSRGIEKRQAGQTGQAEADRRPAHTRQVGDEIKQIGWFAFLVFNEYWLLFLVICQCSLKSKKKRIPPARTGPLRI